VRYVPDFAYVDAATSELVYVEVKGAVGWKLDSESRTKWRTAADLFLWARFEAAIQRRKKDGGGWVVEVYEPR